ncbi:hypothetical protein VSU19_07840 [Verrucomicrobiales bacterium BCK34]|nr:hypothetical protein [Verrucomicrobiales bacterium BCK34]
MDSFDIWPLGEFALQLGIARNTAKRLFDRQVFGDDWLVKTPGGHWRVQMNQDRLKIAKVLLTRWQLFSRKPEASKALPDSLATEGIAIRVFEVRVLDDSCSVENIDEINRLIFSEEGAKFYNLLISAFKAECKSKEGASRLEILSAHLNFIQKWGREAEVSIVDLADELHCSVRSLYRKPFGKDCMDGAAKLLQRFLSCPHGVERVDELAGHLDRDPKVSEVREALLVSPSEADDLLEAWKEGRNINETFPDPIIGQFEELTNEDFARSGEARETTRRCDNSPARKALKALSDSKRRQRRSEYLLRWELVVDGVGHETLFLYADRRYEVEKLQEFKDGKISPPERHLKAWRASLTGQPGRHSIGCIFQEGEGGFVWRLFEGLFSEGEASDYHAALSTMVENLQGLRFHDSRCLVTPLEDLAKMAPQKWCSPRLRSPKSVI